jgi:hypothetical protein
MQGVQERSAGLAMTGRRAVGAIVVLVAALVLYAWIDGGEEPLRPIAQPVALPGAAR